MLFVGDDWAEDHHDIEIVDEQGRRFVFFLIAGVPYPALLALVVALLDALPQIGAFLASLIGTVVALS